MRFLFAILFGSYLFAASVLYQLQDINDTEIANSPFDIIVTAFSKDVTVDKNLTDLNLKLLHDKNKTVLCYLSIGEAADYMPYFKHEWIDENGMPNDNAPAWLGNENPEWEGDYKVRFWYGQWYEEYLKPLLEKIINSGFDGVYLDIVDGYEYWADSDNYTDYGGVEKLLEGDPINDENLSANRMIDLIVKISTYAKSKNPQFLIVPQNALKIITYDYRNLYFEHIDGVGLESLFYNETKPQNYKYRLSLAKKFKQNGKFVLVTDYVDDGSGFVGENKERIIDFLTKALKNGFYPYVSDTSRLLKSINKISFKLAPHFNIFTNKFLNTYNIGIGSSEGIDFEGKDGSAVWLDVVDLMVKESKLDTPYYDKIKDYNLSMMEKIKSNLTNADFLVLWLTNGWEEGWFNIEKLQNFLDHNKTLIFNYYYFGDVMGGDEGFEYVLLHKDEYLKNSIKVGEFLSKLKGNIAVVMEPEFNKVWIKDKTKAKKFASILSKAIENIKSKADVLISIGLMDTGRRDGNYKFEDINEWNISSNVISYLEDKLDFITISELVSDFHKDTSKFPQNFVVKHTYDETYLDKRIANWSSFLNQKYMLPVLLGYIAIPEDSWNDLNGDNQVQPNEILKNGWINNSVRIYYHLKRDQKELFKYGLIGFAPMALFDDPQHDINGYQYLSNNEYHIGLIHTDALDGVDLHRKGKFFLKSKNSITLLDVIYSNNEYQVFEKGWNLVSLNKEMNLSLFPFIWTYKYGKWYLKTTLDINHTFENIDNIEENRGYWVYSDGFYITGFKYKNIDINLTKGWNLVNKTDDNSKIMWKYDRGIWYYKGNYDIDYEKFYYLTHQEGVWVYK